MTDRIDKYLDGGLERIALTPEERADADTIEGAIDEIRAVVHAAAAPDLTDRVMGLVVQARPRPTRTWRARPLDAVADLWRPLEVSFRFRPAYGLAAAVALGVLVFIVSSGLPVPVNQAPTTVDAGAPKLFVQFHLEAAEAKKVQLAGTFTGWQPIYELHQSAPGIWTVTLPLSLGVHDYAFVVDGQRWVPDPFAPTVDDGFGGLNSRIALLPPEPPRS